MQNYPLKPYAPFVLPRHFFLFPTKGFQNLPKKTKFKAKYVKT